jgi:hypothetical protein
MHLTENTPDPTPARQRRRLTIPRRRPRAAGAVRVALAVQAALAAGCGGRAALPAPGAPTGPVPDLRGARVMLFPIQALEGVAAEADAELAFALARRQAGVEWVLAEDMRRAGSSSPGLDIRIEGLPVGVFMQAEVRRVGDPLFGYLRRMGALVSSDVALVPVRARYRSGSPPGSDRPAVAPGIEIAAALIAVRTGDVLWFGVEDGDPGAGDDPRVLASAAEALSRRILPLPAREQR